MKYKPHIPQDVGELLDLLADMLFAAPTFKDKTGYFPQKNIATAFLALNEGLLSVRRNLGEECYAALRATSDKMRALFEADPDDKTGDAHAGCMLIHKMEHILTSVARR
jgi:hypothetical protein